MPALTSAQLLSLAGLLRTALNFARLKNMVRLGTGKDLYEDYVGEGKPLLTTIEELLRELEKLGTTEQFLAVVYRDLPARKDVRTAITTLFPQISSPPAQAPDVPPAEIDRGSAAFQSAVRSIRNLYLGSQDVPVPFGGREQEVSALNAWLEGGAEGRSKGLLAGNPASSNLLITAPAGRGKTALLLHWLEQRPRHWSLVFVPISIRYRTNEALTFLRALAVGLGEILGETILASPVDPPRYYRDKIIEYRDKIAQGSRRCLVVIDGLDEARGWAMDPVLFPPSVSPTLKIVVSARERAGDQKAQWWLDQLDWLPQDDAACTLEVPSLSRSGVEDVLRKLAVPNVPLAQNVDIVTELYRLTEKGDPFLLRLYVDLLKGDSRPGGLQLKELRNFKPGFGAYFKRWLREQREEWKESGIEVDEALLDCLLAIFACAFGPLKLADLQGLVPKLNPKAHIGSVNSIEPLGRFILGDGIDTGFVLTHPKLASYLEQSHFGPRSEFLSRTRSAFIDWMAGNVRQLNTGIVQPHEASEYTLLFYTQHLEMMPAGKNLALYRELLENGWRKAWESHEGGFQGFCRDVELACHAFEAAAERKPEHLLEREVGLGGLIRGMLCLSSARSIGLGIPGPLLAEFLRTGSITPKQALYFAELKEEHQRSSTLRDIVEFLPKELCTRAYASAREIKDPDYRYRALLAVLKYLEAPTQALAVAEALEISRQFEHVARQGALKELQPYMSDASWEEAAADAEKDRKDREDEERAKAVAEEARKTQADAEQAKTSEPSPAADPFEDRPWSFYSNLRDEARREDLGDERMKEIVELAFEGRGWNSHEIFRELAPRLPDALKDLALDCIWSKQGHLYRSEILQELIPFLDQLQARQALHRALTEYRFSSMARALAQRVTEDGLDKELELVLAFENEYDRNRALGGLAPHLSAASLTTALRQVLSSGGYTLPAALGALAPYLSAEQLHEATNRIAAIADIDDRGRALAILLPRHRELGIQLSAVEAHRIAFAIGDRIFRTAANAALLPSLSDKLKAEALSTLTEQLTKPTTSSDEDSLVLEILAVLLTTSHLPTRVAAEVIERAATIAQEIKNGVRALAMGAVAFHLAPAQRERVLEQAAAIARSAEYDTASLLAAFATFCPRPTSDILLQEARSRSKVSSGKDLQDLDLIRVLSPLTKGDVPDALQQELDDSLDHVFQMPRGFNRALCLALALALWPRLPVEKLDLLIQKLVDAIREDVEPKDRPPLVAAIAAYLPAKILLMFLKEILAFGRRSSRPSVLVGLLLAQGLAGEVWKGNDMIAANRLPGSPIARLGGDISLVETYEAIRDICEWWT